MTSSTAPANAGDLLKGAVSEGVLSQDALNVIGLRDIGAEINAAIGVSVDDVKASEVILLTLLVDDSSSINFAKNAQPMRDGHNLIIDALTATKQKDGILVMCRYLNKGLLSPYVPVAQAVRMDDQNYRPNGGTPLYDEAITTLAAVLAKCQDFQNNGIACRTVTGILTDGGDSGSKKRAQDVAKIVRDMLVQENHIIAFVGVDDGSTDFKQVAADMGIQSEWVLTPGNSPSEIRKAFAMLSQSAIRASQTAAAFSQTAMGGFGN